MSNHTRGRHAAPSKSRPPILAILLILGLAAVGCASAQADSTPRSAGEPEQTELETVAVECADFGENDSFVRTGDDGHTLLIDHKGEEDADGATFEEVACVLFELDVPDSVVAQMDSTRALDGRQSAGWDGYEVSWAYHPDSGIDMIVTEG